MVEVLGAIINAMKKVKKVTKRMQLMGRTVSAAMRFVEIVKGMIIGWLKGALITLLLVAVLLGGIVQGIVGVFDFFKSLGGSSNDPVVIAQTISDVDADRFVEMGGINPKKLKDYAQVEADSYPKSVKLKMHTIDDGKDTTSDYTLDLSSFSAKFKIPWQFTAGLDVINGTANDKKDKVMIDASKTNMAPTFIWGYDKYTKDVINSKKEWLVETTQDKDSKGILTGNKVEIKDTESKARQIDVTKKWPLAYADEVTTAFKHYLYEYTLDKVTRDDPWSKPIVVDTNEWDETVQDGYEDDLTKPIYGDDDTAPIYGNDYTKLIYENVKYNKFKIYLRDEYFTVKDNLTGGHNFSAVEWFTGVVDRGSTVVFQDTSYWGSGLTMTLNSYTVGYNDEFYYDSSSKIVEWTGNYEQKITGYGQRVTGYVQKAKYKKVHHVTTSYKITKKKIIEDVLSNKSEFTDPQRLLSFFASNNINLDDLGIIHAILEEMPNTGELKNDIQAIMDGGYSNSGVGGIGGGVIIDGSSLSSAIPLFLQWDKRWGSVSYGNGSIAATGCGPTSMAMVITGLRGKVAGIDNNNDGIVDPTETCAYSVANGFRTANQGTSWGFFSSIGAKSGLKVTQVAPNGYQKVLDHLLKGNPVIASMGPGHFTKGGHFIVLTGVDASGKITIKDPNSEIKSKQSWDFASIVLAEARQFWLVENPDMFNSEGIFQVTTYGGVRDGMQGYGITADGTDLTGMDFRDRVIAVDRTKIKLGTRVFMEFPENKRYMYKDSVKYDLNGWYTARDTGGAIKQNIIDLFVGYGGAADTKRANEFGRVDGIKVRWRK